MNPIARLLAAVLCAGSVLLAAAAWWTHAEWRRTGAYETNSFPMGVFARDATWVAVGVCGVTALTWFVVVKRRERRRTGEGLE